MRTLIAILGIFAMLVVLQTPVAAFALAPCNDSSMAMPDETGPCGDNDMACMAPCLASAKCQSQCAYSPPFVHAASALVLSPVFIIAMALMEEGEPLGAYSPVEGPPQALIPKNRSIGSVVSPEPGFVRDEELES